MSIVSTVIFFMKCLLREPVIQNCLKVGHQIFNGQSPSDPGDHRVPFRMTESYQWWVTWGHLNSVPSGTPGQVSVEREAGRVMVNSFCAL